jgi:PAS domain S-box-containing protein
MEPVREKDRSGRVATWSACIAAALCALVAIAWVTSLPMIARAVPELPTMKFNGALAFGLLALAILAYAGRSPKPALLLLGAAMLIGIATGAQALLGMDFGIDQWLVTDPEVGVPHPGRMALSAVMCLLALGGAMLWRILRPQAPPHVWRALTSMALVVAYTGSMGLLTQVRWEGWLSPIFGAFSVPVAAVILLLGIAVSAAEERRADSVTVAASGVAGAVYARIALPIGLLIPVSTAWASSLVSAPLGVQAPTGAAVALALSGTLFAMLVLASARWITQLEGALLLERRGLERLVEVRTAQFREAEQREMQARLQLEMIVNSADVAIAAVDEQGRLLLFNAAAERLFGLARTALLGRRLDALLPPEVRDAHDEWVRAFGQVRGEARQMGSGRPVTGQRADGTRFPMEATISASANEPKVVTVVIRDLSMMHQFEAERLARGKLDAEHRAQRELLKQINHEFRTPLNAVMGFSSLLSTQPEVQLSEHARRYVQLIAEAGQALLTQVEDLTELGKLGVNRLRLDVREVELQPVVRSCLALQRQLALEARLDWPSELVASEPLVVLADENRLRQILTNLLRNAIKYNRPGGYVRVEGQSTGAGQSVEIRVTDGGIGMTEAQVSVAFEPYNRAGRERSAIEGSGLGLPIARRLAEAMHGSLTAKSQVSVGSIFTLTLPAPRGGRND